MWKIAWMILLVYSVFLVGVFAYARTSTIRFDHISWPVLVIDIGLVGWLVSSPVPNLPCEPALVIAQDRVELSCTTDSLPPLVNQALSEVNP